MGAPPPRIQTEVQADKHSPVPQYQNQVVVKSSGPRQKNPAAGFWTPQIIETHQHVPSYFELTSQYSISAQEDQKMSMDRYYSIQQKYENLRAQMYDDLDREYQQDQYQGSQPMSDE